MRRAGRGGLPPLPEMHYAMLQPAPNASEAVLAFCQVFRDVARLSFRTGNALPT